MQCVRSGKQRRLSTVLPYMLRVMKPEIMRVYGGAGMKRRWRNGDFAQVLEGYY